MFLLDQGKALPFFILAEQDLDAFCFLNAVSIHVVCFKKNHGPVPGALPNDIF